MKARYTPLQTAVVERRGDPSRSVSKRSTGLEQTPVVCAPLHSMLGPIAAGAKRAGDARVVYVMTDGAALPGAFSGLVFELRDAGLLDGWITCGQAFGGELEAVTVWTACSPPRRCFGADVIVVADGPGNLGTDTTWGVSALGSGNALNAVAALGADRSRRCGSASPTSAHGTAASRTTRSRSSATCAWCRPTCRCPCSRTTSSASRSGMRSAPPRSRNATSSWRSTAVRRSTSWPIGGIEPRSMGRGVDDDPLFFLAAGAAGVLAGRSGGGQPCAGARPATTRPSRDRRRLDRRSAADPLADPDEMEVADPGPDQHQTEVDDHQDHPEHPADRAPRATSGARRSSRPNHPARVSSPSTAFTPDRDPDDHGAPTGPGGSTGCAASGRGGSGLRHDRHHMCAMSCSTRSSTLRNGSLHRTVRCAWSLSFRCTQSTV